MDLLYISVASGLLALVLLTIDKRAKRKLAQPRFHANHVGGRHVFCAITDFKKAVPGNAPQKKTMVPETITIPKEDLWWVGSRFPWTLNRDLFVPFTSSGLMPIDAQKAFFMPQPLDNLAGFLEAKDQEAFVADPMLRLARFWNKWPQGLHRVFFLFAVFSLALGVGILIADSLYVRPATFLATDGTGVKEYTMRESVTFSHERSFLRHGKVTGVQPVAQGTSIVCIEYKYASSMTLCAVTSQSYNIGDEAYLRSFSVLVGEKDRMAFQSIAFFISKAEADALIATDKYHMQ